MVRCGCPQIGGQRVPRAAATPGSSSRTAERRPPPVLPPLQTPEPPAPRQPRGKCRRRPAMLLEPVRRRGRRQAGGGFVLAHDLSPVMLLVPAAARGSASVRAVPTATRWAIIPAGKSVRAVSSLNPIVAWSARWRCGFNKMRWRFTTHPDDPLGSSLWRPAARPTGRRSPACRRR